MTIHNHNECENHKLDICCLGCVKAWIARHDKMLEFIKKLTDESYSHFENENEINWVATELLIEIGVIKNG